MNIINLVIPSLVGLIIGALLPLIIGVWFISPAGNLIRQGYVNAVAVGLLLAAALQFIPSTLTEVELASYTLVTTYIIPPTDPGSSLAPWPVYFQVIIRSLGVLVILILFIRGSAPTPVADNELLSNQNISSRFRTRWRLWLALPAEDQVDRTGIIIVTTGLFCYNLWRGTIQVPLGPGKAQLFIDPTLLTFSGAVLGVAILGLLPDPRQHWRWLIGVSVLLGLAVVLGMTGPVERIVLMVALLVLLPGTVCLVYGIGRLLRILQDQIGLGWRTTLTVGISGAILYFGNQLLSRLI